MEFTGSTKIFKLDDIKCILLSLSIFIKSLHLIYSGGSGEPSTFLKNENKMQALYKQLRSRPGSPNVVC